MAKNGQFIEIQPKDEYNIVIVNALNSFSCPFFFCRHHVWTTGQRDRSWEGRTAGAGAGRRGLLAGRGGPQEVHLPGARPHHHLHPPEVQSLSLQEDEEEEEYLISKWKKEKNFFSFLIF